MRGGGGRGGGGGGCSAKIDVQYRVFFLPVGWLA